MLCSDKLKPSGAARNLRLYPRSQKILRSESTTSLKLFSSKGVGDMLGSRGTEQATILIGSRTSALTLLSGVRARTWSAVKSSSSFASFCIVHRPVKKDKTRDNIKHLQIPNHISNEYSFNFVYPGNSSSSLSFSLFLRCFVSAKSKRVTRDLSCFRDHVMICIKSFRFKIY